MTDASGKATPKTAPSATTEEDHDEVKKEKLAKEVPLVHDQGFFQHQTGDMYDGWFEAKKKDLTVKMHGPGVYTTAEGDTYSGFWDTDKLMALEGTTVTFNDGAKYEGILKEFCYTSKGKYTYPDGSVLMSEFNDDQPVGNLVLTDPNGHIWLGKAEQGHGWFEPVNHFYDLLETTQTRVKRRHKVDHKAVSTTAQTTSPKVTSTPSPTPVSKAKTKKE